jgi:hypothetical protein
MSVLDNTIIRTSCLCPSTLWQQRAVPTVAAKGPVWLKAKVHATRTKQMALAFFKFKDLIYTNLKARGTNGEYLVHHGCHG